MQETQVLIPRSRRSFSWEMPRTEEPGQLQSMRSQRDTTQQLNNNNSGQFRQVTDLLRSSHSHCLMGIIILQDITELIFWSVLNQCLIHSKYSVNISDHYFVVTGGQNKGSVTGWLSITPCSSPKEYILIQGTVRSSPSSTL